MDLNDLKQSLKSTTTQQLPQTSPSKAQLLFLFFSEHSPMAGYVAWAAMMMDSTTMITTKNLRTLALAWPLS
jgi:hypothetical protein